MILLVESDACSICENCMKIKFIHCLIYGKTFQRTLSHRMESTFVYPYALNLAKTRARMQE